MKGFFLTFVDSISAHYELFSNAIWTLIILLFIFLGRITYTRSVLRKIDLSMDEKRRLIVNTRNITLIIMLISIIMIWGAEIKGYALSVAAIAVAITMSFKEMITNFMGGVARTISRPFNIGDRISISNYRGDVIDISMLTTTILEIGPGFNSHQYTGSAISVPNSLLLNTPIINESFIREYQLHVFSVAIKHTEIITKHEKYLLEASNIVCTPYLNKARNYSETVFRKNSVEPPSFEPRVLILMDNADYVKLLVRVPVPAQRKGKIEQEIMRRYVEMLENEYIDTKVGIERETGTDI